MVVKEKARSYAKHALGNDFIPLVIKTYGCFHSCFGSFLIACAQIILHVISDFL